jgi:Tol biopolymer transport system component
MKILTTLLLLASLSAFSQEKTEILIKNETHGHVDTREPVFSPDGKTLVYSTYLNRDGAFELYSMDLKSGERKRLTDRNETHGYVGAYSPVFSPDGKTLVYTTDLNKNGVRELYSMDLKSGEKKRLTKFNETHGDVDAREPVFSPDGKTLVYTADLNKDGFFELYSMDLKSGEKKRLTEFNETHGDVDAKDPVFSPDGKTLVYTTDLNKDYTYELYSMDLKSGERKRLTEFNETHGYVGAWSPVFSPDGKTLVYSTNLNKNGTFELYSMDLKSGERKRLIDRKGNVYKAVLDLYPGKKNINKEAELQRTLERLERLERLEKVLNICRSDNSELSKEIESLKVSLQNNNDSIAELSDKFEKESASKQEVINELKLKIEELKIELDECKVEKGVVNQSHRFNFSEGANEVLAEEYKKQSAR